MTKPTAHIEQWRIAGKPGDRFLIGAISGHVNQDSFHASLQKTSALQELDEQKGIAVTRNTIYTLGSKYEPSDV